MRSFYMDHQFRAAVARGIRQRGIDVLTAFEDGAEPLRQFSCARPNSAAFW
jgi:hypothetical protein